MNQRLNLNIILLCILTLTSCSSNKYPAVKLQSSHIVSSATATLSTGPSLSNNANDRALETYNRQAFRMNMKLDATIVRPTAVAYSKYTPSPLRYGINNFFNNLRDFVTLGNDILQLNGMNTMQTSMRIAINTTVGLLGVIDISSGLGLTVPKNTFGKTMKAYGWTHSRYFVIPLLGPSTIRDALGMIPDIYFNPVWIVVDNYYISIGLFTINAIDSRSLLLETDKLLYLSLDPYIAMRDLYMQAIGEGAVSNSNNDVDIDTLLEESGTK